MNPEQREILKKARAVLCELQEGPNRLNPLVEDWNKVTELIASIEEILGY